MMILSDDRLAASGICQPNIKTLSEFTWKPDLGPVSETGLGWRFPTIRPNEDDSSG